VNISSVAGTHPQPGFVAYGVGKAALGWMTRNLAQDFAPKVRVNAIAVGATRTAALENFMNEKLEKAILSRTPMGRLGSTEDIAACALYLASPASAYMTGQILNVDGGITATPVEMHRAGL
jgi:7-alpha-hydroxysteroid dehydrogenase